MGRYDDGCDVERSLNLILKLQNVLVHINNLKTKININYVWRLTSSRKSSIVGLYFKNQPVYVVYGNKRCLFRDPHKTYKQTLWAESTIFES